MLRCHSLNRNIISFHRTVVDVSHVTLHVQGVCYGGGSESVCHVKMYILVRRDSGSQKSSGMNTNMQGVYGHTHA